jgi:hypothetical protein
MVDNDRIEIFIRGIFRLEDEIRLAVVEAKTIQCKGMTGGGGHAVVSDPTAATATRHLSELRSVRVGERIIKKPETWLRVIALTYKLAPARECEIMRKHYTGAKFTKEFANACGYEVPSLYAFRRAFEWRAVAVACQLGVLAVVDEK